MPVTTLQNLSVPFEGEGNSSLLMPKLQYRFRVTFDGFGAGTLNELKVLQREVIDLTRPNLTFEQITVDAYNSRAYLAGKHTWEPITINIRDDSSNNVQKAVGSQIQKQFDFFNQSSNSLGADYKFTTNIEILDGGNASDTARVLERFEILGCYIESANYNALNYATSDVVSVSLTIRYDNALQYGESNVPQGVGIPQITQARGPA